MCGQQASMPSILLSSSLKLQYFKSCETAKGKDKTMCYYMGVGDAEQARLYTQNIDGLESAAGLPPSAIVAAHGGFDTATCVATGEKVLSTLATQNRRLNDCVMNGTLLHG